MGLLASINKNTIQSIVNYINNKISGYTPKFNANNTASGIETVTLNESSGVLTFSKPVTSGAPSRYTLNNSLVKANSVVRWGITYDQLGDEQPFPLVYTSSDGAISFFVGIYNGDTTGDTFCINFEIIG